MTTLDPSHLPWLAHTSDKTTGGAVHTSVRAPASGIRHTPYGREADDSSSGDEGDSDLDFLKRRRKSHRARRRQEREDARQAGRIPTLPVPDVRFEQSYLMSIQPFIHASSAPGPSTSSLEPSKTARDKRRRVEESLALVEDPASRRGNPINALFPETLEEKRLISIDWGSIAYITVRDQVFSPLVQGALWALGGIALTGVRTYWGARGPLFGSPSSGSTRSGPGLLDRLWRSLNLNKE